ncbi:hypothetical protein BKA57DRAFT_151709 [Linnemannia elongata]|nr:hypothetical protein BKA57DRAFT_151709 [Linnemannia elongata]
MSVRAFVACEECWRVLLFLAPTHTQKLNAHRDTLSPPLFHFILFDPFSVRRLDFSLRLSNAPFLAHLAESLVRRAT